MPLANPYKLQPLRLRELRFDVGEDDFNRVFGTCPRRGQMDAILGNLFHKLAAEITSTIPLPTSSSAYRENEEKISSILARTTFNAPL